MRSEEFYSILQSTDSHLQGRNKSLLILQKCPNCLERLFTYSLDENEKVQAVASYLLLDLLYTDFTQITPYFKRLLQDIPKIQNESVKRIVSRIVVLALQGRYVVPSKAETELLGQYALNWLTDGSKVATESNAMDILIYLRKGIPELFELAKELVVANCYLKSVAYQNKVKRHFAL